jgi:putative FmdB family regulatory protein
MPIFEYVCRACHHQFETLVTVDRRPACPSCHGADLDKQLSVFAVSSKGAPEPMPAGCGRCGDPRGPGACGMN